MLQRLKELLLKPFRDHTNRYAADEEKDTYIRERGEAEALLKYPEQTVTLQATTAHNPIFFSQPHTISECIAWTKHEVQRNTPDYEDDPDDVEMLRVLAWMAEIRPVNKRP